VTSSSVTCVERLEFSGVLRRYSVNKNELLRRLLIVQLILLVPAKASPVFR
jgi:hypothetical protein